MDWTLTHLEEVKSNCKHQLYINQPLPPEITSDPSFMNNSTESDRKSTSVNDTVSSSQTFTPEFLEKVEKLSCTNECYGNGYCNAGKQMYTDEHIFLFLFHNLHVLFLSRQLWL